MGYSLQRCAQCGRFTDATRSLCPACVRDTRRQGRSALTKPGWTHFTPLDLASILAPLVALAMAAGLYGECCLIGGFPHWFSPTDTGSSLPLDYLRGGVQVGVLTALLAAVAGFATLFPLRFTRGLWLPTWMLPLSGRWLKYLAAGILPYGALLWGIQQGSLWAIAVSGFSLCLVLGLLLWEGLFFLPEIDACVTQAIRHARLRCPLKRRNGVCP